MDAKLVIFKADGQRKDIPITNKVSVIGRAENCEFRIPLVSVSRKHCELTITTDGLKIKDLASSNGTFVNNKRINEQILRAGDRIVIGPIVFTVVIDGRPQEVKPAKAKPAALPGDDFEDAPSDQTANGDIEDDGDVISALEAMTLDSDEKPKSE